MSEDIKPFGVEGYALEADELSLHVASLWATVLPSIQGQVRRHSRKLEDLLGKLVKATGYKEHNDFYSDKFAASFQDHVEDLVKAKLGQEQSLETLQTENKTMEHLLLYMESALAKQIRLEGIMRKAANIIQFDLPAKLALADLDDFEVNLTAKLNSEVELRVGWERAQMLFGGSTSVPPPPQLESLPVKTNEPDPSLPFDPESPPAPHTQSTETNMDAQDSNMGPTPGQLQTRRILKPLGSQPSPKPSTTSSSATPNSNFSPEASSNSTPTLDKSGLAKNKKSSGVKHVIKSLSKFLPNTEPHVAISNLKCSCGFKAYTNGFLKTHILQQTTEWTYHCYTCKYYFFYRSTLERHVCNPSGVGRRKRNSSQVPDVQACRYCGQMLKNKSEISVDGQELRRQVEIVGSSTQSNSDEVKMPQDTVQDAISSSPSSKITMVTSGLPSNDYGIPEAS